MKTFTSYRLLVFALFLLAVCPSLRGKSPAKQDPAVEDSVRVQDMLLLDTIDMKIHGPSNDLAFYMNGLVFLSNSKYHQKMIPDHITFGQVQTYFVPLEYVAIESSRPLFKNDPFPYSPGGLSFSRDYQRVYYTKSLLKGGRRAEDKIFETSIINGEVSPGRQLPFCNGSDNYMHPAVSEDGSMMIFASDRSPSTGGLDLFIVRKESGNWGQPQNLGTTINTPANEWFPFLDQHLNLFFSSSGHLGYGGYDIYYSPFNGTGWEEPRNLTELVNASGDDLAFSIHPNKRQVVYSKSGGDETPGDMVLNMKLNAGALLVHGVDERKSKDISLLIHDLVQSGYTTAEFGSIIETAEAIVPAMVRVEPLLSEVEEEQTAEPESEPEPILLIEPEKDPPEQDQPEQAPETEQTELSPLAIQLEVAPEPVEEPELVQAETEPESEPESEPELVQEEADPEPEPEREPEVEPVVEPEVEEPAATFQPEPDEVIFRVQFLSRPKPNSMPEIVIEGKRYPTFEYYYKGAYRITAGGFATVKEAIDFRALCKNAGYNQAFVAAFRGNERELDPAVFKR
jgi:hypothetical protein